MLKVVQNKAIHLHITYPKTVLMRVKVLK